MTPTTRPAAEPTSARRGRPPKGAALLTRDAIVDAAIAVIDVHGVGAVTMRSVAGRLGVDAKSLYNHVADKEALLDAVAERVLARLELPEPTGECETDLRAFARAFRQGTLAHPHAASLVLTRQLSSSAALAPVGAVISVLRRAGASAEESVHLMRSLVATLVGTLLREVEAGPTFGVSDADAIDQRREVLAGSGLPGLAEAAPYLATFDHDREFDYALDLVIAAVIERLGKPETSARGASRRS